MRVEPQDFERFFTKIDCKGPKIIETPCWTWTATKNRDGYGQFHLNDRLWRSHLLSFTLFVGPLPSGMLTMHRCHNPSCVNPAHLQAGTPKENSEDAVRSGRLSRKGGRPIASERVDEARRLRRSGLSLQKISAIVGVNVHTVHKYVRETTEQD